MAHWRVLSPLIHTENVLPFRVIPFQMSNFQFLSLLFSLSIPVAYHKTSEDLLVMTPLLLKHGQVRCWVWCWCSCILIKENKTEQSFSCTFFNYCTPGLTPNTSPHYLWYILPCNFCLPTSCLGKVWTRPLKTNKQTNISVQYCLKRPAWKERHPKVGMVPPEKSMSIGQIILKYVTFFSRDVLLFSWP